MKLLAVVCLFALVSFTIVEALPSLDKVYSAWFCGDDSCLWAHAPSNNQTWLLNRGDGSPTVNVIVSILASSHLSSPSSSTTASSQLVALSLTTTIHSRSLIPCNCFRETYPKVSPKISLQIYVMFSIGGAAFASNWDQALNQNAAKLATNAAAIANAFGVGMEIDYEQDSGASMNLLTTFVKTYRSIIPYDSSASPSPQSILTVDLGAGTGYLSAISATAGGWLSQNLVNWAYAMVSGDPNGDNTQYWEQHLQGATWANIPPMNPHQLVGSLYASSGANDCASYAAPLPNAVAWINQNKARGIGFWAVGCPAGPNQCANNCPGIQQGSKAFLG